MREVKLYFSLKGVFFSCQQPRLHQPLLDSPLPPPPSTPHASSSTQFPSSLPSPLYLSPSPFLLLLPPSHLKLCRGQIGDIIFSGTEFFCHAVILRVPFCPCVQDRSKTFFYSCNQCLCPVLQQLGFFFCTPSPFLNTQAHVCLHTSDTLLNTHTFFSPFLPEAIGSLLNADIR